MLMDQVSTKQYNKRNAMRCICFALFASALLVRLLKLLLDPALMRDAALYLVMADSWYETGDYAHTLLYSYVPPFPLLTIKSLMASGIGAEAAGRTLSLFFGSMTAVIAFLFVFKLCRNIRIALLTGILFIFHPDLVTYSVQPLRENIYIFFIGALLTMIVDAVHDNSAVKWGICGIPLSLAFFSRYETAEFFLIIPVIIVILLFLKRIKLKQAFFLAVSLGLTFILTSVVVLSFVEFKSAFLLKIYYWLDRFIS